MQDLQIMQVLHNFKTVCEVDELAANVLHEALQKSRQCRFFSIVI
jgi:hypothetical protein